MLGEQLRDPSYGIEPVGRALGEAGRLDAAFPQATKCPVRSRR